MSEYKIDQLTELIDHKDIQGSLEAIDEFLKDLGNQYSDQLSTAEAACYDLMVKVRKLIDFSNHEPLGIAGCSKKDSPTMGGATRWVCYMQDGYSLLDHMVETPESNFYVVEIPKDVDHIAESE